MSAMLLESALSLTKRSLIFPFLTYRDMHFITDELQEGSIGPRHMS